MSDDLTRRGPEDPNTINVHERWELTYWCRTLGVTEAQLRAAVAAVGTSVRRVRQHLGK